MLRPLLSKETILERVSPLQIFEAFIEGPTGLGAAISSPLRDGDSNPSFTLFKKDGNYFYKDFGADESGDVFDFVAKLTDSPSFKTTLEYIDSKLKLGIKEGTPLEVTIRRKEEEEYEAQEKHIQVKIKRFSEKDLEYWEQYHLDHTDLKRIPSVQVYSVDRYWINGKLSYINWGELCFAYHFPEIDKVKIYMPNSESRKWISNVPLNYMYGMENIQEGCEKALVINSVKDLLVCSKYHSNTCGSQNESIGAITEANMEKLKSKAKQIYIFFDSDAAGKKASLALTERYQVDYLNTPNYLLKHNVKDPSDWEKHDFGALEYFLKLWKSN